MGCSMFPGYLFMCWLFIALLDGLVSSHVYFVDVVVLLEVVVLLLVD